MTAATELGAAIVRDTCVQPKRSAQTAARLRVVMVAARYYPFLGGIETHVYEVSRRLAAQGVDVTVLTTDPSGTLPREELSDGVLVRRVPAYPAHRDYYWAPGIYHEVLHGGWDLVHCQGIHTLVPPLAMIAARRAGLPYLVSFHTGGHSSRLRTALRRGQWLALRPLLAHASHLLGVSRFEAELFRTTLRLPAARFSVIRNGGRLPEVEDDAQPEAAPTLIVSTGRLERYKGHQRVIAALPDVRRAIPDARLLVLGSGPYERELRAMADRLHVGDAVEIRAIPPAERGAMARTLRGAAVIALMSDYEAHPVAVMEALALGRPVVAADTSGLSELIEEGLVRGLARDAAPGELARALIEEITQPRSALAMTLPTWEDCALNLLDLYAESAGRRCAS